MSLTVNAAQSVPAGDTVLLTARRGDGGVYLDLKDQGHGSFLSRVRGRFYGARPATTGVGLAAAYDIVRRHGGKIEAKVNVRKGFEFSVWLPLRRDCADGNWQGSGGGGR
jgi:signal transduction histidine kinase